MFVEKLNARIIHKFIKQFIDETVTTVDLRNSSIENSDKRKGIIYAQTKQGLEPNLIVYDDKSFCISVSNYSESKLLKSLSEKQINFLWQEYLTKTFGNEYFEHLSETKSV